MKRLVLTDILLFLLFGGLCASCAQVASRDERRLVDSLNNVAYACRYKNLNASAEAARGAYEAALHYADGRAEACNGLGFEAFMRMDFEQAVRWHEAVYGLTRNELELLIADVGLMKVYQRTSLNKEFYDYRNSALRRMKRIAEEETFPNDERGRRRLDYARSEFDIVSAVYYYYLQQRPEALACMAEVAANATAEADTNQLLYYHYIKGASALCEGDSVDERRLREFDELYATWQLASRYGYLYFEGNGVQGLANLMATPEDFAFFAERRGHALTRFDLPVDSLLPMRLGQLALQKFRTYDDLYQIAGAYVSIGRYLNAHGRYTEALDTLCAALECVNRHHRYYYHCEDSLDWLKTYDGRDTLCVEKSWMMQRLMTVPEWISRIREQLSVAYAGQGMKHESDYNRNVYLDILEDTRQDKELESRYDALAGEAQQLNVLLALVGLGFVLLPVCFGFFNRRSKARNRAHLHRLQLILDICQQITSFTPADAEDEEDIARAILHVAGEKLDALFGMSGIAIRDRALCLPQRPTKEQQAIANVINPYIQWALDSGMASISLSDEHRRLEKQRYVHEQHIAAGKRRNVVKKACLAIVTGIRPYIDRILNEVHKLVEKGYINDDAIKREKYQYIDELVSTINEYNDILALWIKMRQGTLSLNIENFELNELFDLLRKGNRAFELRQQHLEVTPTDACVKADKALTLFMINTLAENARKYTPRGGEVKVYARSTEEYVEVSVEDNGCGLSPEDVAHIVGEKVYDSKAIGLSTATDKEALRRSKGSGFGLMNCKGIIEKYRKTNALFGVCRFAVESRPGEGSRFYFRLPIGLRKVLSVCCLCLTGLLAACEGTPTQATEEGPVSDTLSAEARYEYEELLDIASDYANDAYFANVDGRYGQALLYADSAIACLNEHYVRYASSSGPFMTLTGEGQAAEQLWWNEPFNSDFHVILDVRNEAAVAFLALKEWEAYSYNNAAYTTLYKLLGEDQSLEEYCRRLERSTTHKTIGVALALLLLALLVLGSYILFFRKRLLHRWNLQQVLEINHSVFEASLPFVQAAEGALQEEDKGLQEVMYHIVRKAYEGIDELCSTDCLGIAVYDEQRQTLTYTFSPAEMAEEETEAWHRVMQRCFDRQNCTSEGDFQALPLQVEAGGVSQCVGVLCLKRTAGTGREDDLLLLELVARYVAIVVFNAVLRLSDKYRDIETAHDEARRASWEDGLLHVQNMVLDNCLSTIKHETIYYPNKIKQLIGKLRSGQLLPADEAETVATIDELIAYYKGIFTILSSCASRQLEEVTFRRTTIVVADLLDRAGKYLRKQLKNSALCIEWQAEGADEQVVGDVHLLCFLFENLIDEALTCHEPGRLSLRAVAEGEYVRFLFTDHRRERTREELNHLFYPSLARMTEGERGRLQGTEYLVCKQIIRDHDEYAGRRGCRINAEPCVEGGFTVYFTVPRKTVFNG